MVEVSGFEPECYVEVISEGYMLRGLSESRSLLGYRYPARMEFNDPYHQRLRLSPAQMGYSYFCGRTSEE